MYVCVRWMMNGCAIHIAYLSIIQNLQMFALPEAQILIRPSIIVVESHKDFRIGIWLLIFNWRLWDGHRDTWNLSIWRNNVFRGSMGILLTRISLWLWSSYTISHLALQYILFREHFELLSKLYFNNTKHTQKIFTSLIYIFFRMN